MACEGWNDSDWDTLIDPIQTGKCILMLGPDAAVEEVEGSSKPLTEILANHLSEISQIKELAEAPIDTSNLAQVSLYYEMRTRRRVRPKVEEFYKSKQGQTSPFHENLASLPFHLIITSTPDDMFYNALKKKPDKDPVKAHYDFRGKREDLVGAGKTGTINEPLVFYLYGAIENPNSLVLTENDFLDFLVKIASGSPPLPQNILSELRDKDKSFLFLGFGFRHWYLRILLHILQIESKKYSSFALEQFYVDRLRKDTIYFFRESDYKIQICNAELNRFATELRTNYEKMSAAPIPKAPLKDAPTIFICHASEDKAYAAKLHKELEARGLRPWLDKENLRGGDLWDDKIQTTIKEIDYIVVLTSKALKEKKIGYVNKEIKVALDRQAECQSDIKFIIPVQIDDTPLSDSLKAFHHIDLRDPKSIEELTITITRDQQLRKR